MKLTATGQSPPLDGGDRGLEFIPALAVTRTSSPWMAAVTLKPPCRMNWEICLAAGPSIPCLILMTCRA